MKLSLSDFINFKEHLFTRLKFSSDRKNRYLNLKPSEVYKLSGEMGKADEQAGNAALARMIAEFLNLTYAAEIPYESVKREVLPIPFSKSNWLVALDESYGANAFALSNPFHWELFDSLKKLLRSVENLHFVIAAPDAIETLLKPKKIESSGDAHLSEFESELKELYRTDADPSDYHKEDEDSGPIVQFVNRLIETAYKAAASDVHIEPLENEVVIRFRIEGDLRIISRLKPRSLIKRIAARIKVMSRLDITEHRLPQDGRIAFNDFTNEDVNFELRVATAPMNYGEKIVLRILDQKKVVLPLDKLGFSERNLKIYQEKIRSPWGMILHVGPTGSGKSMSLYSAVNELLRPEINVQTIEDPIEYSLPSINQLQVHSEIGLTFQRALRSFLRQDPDIILVGEIRDPETANTAIEASLTGHLLLSTLHTNDAASTIIRFIKMGIEPFMVSASVLLICAQRLLRRLCSKCKTAHHPDEHEKSLIGAAPNAEIVIYSPTGCDACDGDGYDGRVGVYEILVPNDALHALINRKGVTAEEIKRTAVKTCGMTTLYWDAMEKVRAGISSLEDALLNVQQDEFDSRPYWMAEGSVQKRPHRRPKTTLRH